MYKRMFVIGALLGVTALTVADVPREMTFQGRLTGNGTDPVSIEVRFYDAESGGTLLWSETHQDVPRPNGLFTINIGSQTTGGVPAAALPSDSGAVWLGISINGAAELAPRQAVTSAAYSLITRGIAVNDAGDVRIGAAIGDSIGKLRVVPDGPGVALSIQNPPGGSFEENLIEAGSGNRRIRFGAIGNTGSRGEFVVQTSADGGLTYPERLRVTGDGTTSFSGPIQMDNHPVRLSPQGDLYYIGTGQEGGGSTRLSGWNVSIRSGSGSDERILIEHGGPINLRTRTRVPVLEITGGSDLAEPAHVSDAGQGVEAIQPGMVVSIDPANPGKLMLATEAYDRKVAGVISGAGGVNPGMIMKQEGHATSEGEHPIAMAGKVYVWCDASSAAITPGDRLTTSTTPGHAMKVTNNEQGIGAVIGKAMTQLNEGKGLVLMLVQPQ